MSKIPDSIDQNDDESNREINNSHKKAKKNIFNFLNVNKNVKPIDKDNVYDFIIKKEYKKNQETIFWTVFIGYIVFYFTRRQWNVFGSQLMQDNILSTSNYALVGLIFSVAYGIFKFVSSPLSDTKSNKWLLGMGLMGAGIGNLIVGFSWTNISAGIITPIVLSCVMMVLLGWVHSMGATPCTRFFYNWFPNKQRRSRLISWNVSANIGGAISTFIILGSQTLFSNLLSGTPFSYLGYFLLPSIISVVMGIIVVILIKDTPQSVGLPSNKDYFKMELIGQNNLKKGEKFDDEEGKKWSYFFVKYVIKNKYIWMLAIANMAIYTMRMGVTDWSLKYFQNVHDLDMNQEGKWIYSMLDWGGMVFTLIVGLIANKYLKRFIPATIIVTLISTFGILGIWQLSGNNTYSLASFMMIAGFFYIPQCFLPLLVSEFSHHRVIASASGILGISGYIGDALMSKVVIGFGLINVGWDSIFIFLISCGIVAAVVLIPMMNKRVTI